jgi:hypothetical protein
MANTKKSKISKIKLLKKIEDNYYQIYKNKKLLLCYLKEGYKYFYSDSTNGYTKLDNYNDILNIYFRKNIILILYKNNYKAFFKKTQNKCDYIKSYEKKILKDKKVKQEKEDKLKKKQEKQKKIEKTLQIIDELSKTRSYFTKLSVINEINDFTGDHGYGIDKYSFLNTKIIKEKLNSKANYEN